MLELNPWIEERWTPAEARRWIALGVSALIHALLILWLIFGVPMPAAAPTAAGRPSRDVQSLALQPLPPLPTPRTRPKPQPKAAPQPAVQPPPPPPPLTEQELGPNSKKPDAPAKEAAAKQSDAIAAGTPDQKPADVVPPPPPPAPETPPKPPENQPVAPQRIQVPRPGDYTAIGPLPVTPTSPWGPPKLDSASGDPPAPSSAPATTAQPMGRAGLANRDPQKWENSFDDETSGRCVTIPDLGKNPDGSPVLATVLGRVVDTDGRTPLGGAHLQIQGTTFGTFSDANGNYRLEFDPKLLAQCRKQYVAVVAPGYRSQLLTLMIGPQIRSPDVVLHH